TSRWRWHRILRGRRNTRPHCSATSLVPCHFVRWPCLNLSCSLGTAVSSETSLKLPTTTACSPVVSWTRTVLRFSLMRSKMPGPQTLHWSAISAVPACTSADASPLIFSWATSHALGRILPAVPRRVKHDVVRLQHDIFVRGTRVVRVLGVHAFVDQPEEVAV